jgi:arylsulfatase A-like enzyme
MFERGLIGHGSPLLYESNIHIPLIISRPGQRTREDVFSLTSTVDIVPTLLKITGHSESNNYDEFEGQVLPGFGDDSVKDRIIYSMNTPGNSAFAPIQKASFAMFQDDYKLIEYYGFTELEKTQEIYNLSDDPEELNDLSESKIAIADEMRAVLKAKIDFVSKVN